MTSIGKQVFCGCDGLTSIEIPSSVTSIGEWAFADCFGLSDIRCDSRNKRYTSIDGVLFDKRRKTLIQIPNEKSADVYKIPSSVVKIEGYAVCCQYIRQLHIPSFVTEIHGHAIYADDIEEIIIYHKHPEEIEINLDTREIERTNCVLYVPFRSGKAYKQHPFFGKHFKEVIPIKMPTYDEEPD